MTPQTKMRRGALIEQAIIDQALDYRFSETYTERDNGKRGKKREIVARVVEPRTTESMKARYEHSIDLWNSTADLIDQKCGRLKCGRPIVGVRIIRDGATSCRFEPAASAWAALGTLDRLDADPASQDPDLQPGIVRWMADFLFVALIPQSLFDRAAHTKGHIWDRRLRHTKQAKGRRRQAFIAEASLVLEEMRQGAEFQEFLRETLLRDRKVRRDARLDRNLADFDFSTAPPDVRVVQLADRKSFMLTPPPHGRAKRPPKHPKTK